MAKEQRFKRLYPRRQVSAPCRVSCLDRLIMGKIVDVSYRGVGILLPEDVELNGAASVEIPERVRLRVLPVYNQPVSTREERERHRVGCEVQLIEKGQQAWTNLCHVVRW